MPVRYALPLLITFGLAIYGGLWLVGIHGPGVAPACALASFFGIGAIRKWWLAHRQRALERTGESGPKTADP